MKNAQIQVRRCRPLLGTFVDIQAFGTNSAELESAVEAAFLAIAQVHRLMSFHDLESDVSRMNREAYRTAVHVHPLTWRVLKSAQEFSRKSDGIFDITMAGQLVKWRFFRDTIRVLARAVGATSSLNVLEMSDLADRY